MRQDRPGGGGVETMEWDAGDKPWGWGLQGTGMRMPGSEDSGGRRRDGAVGWDAKDGTLG